MTLMDSQVFGMPCCPHSVSPNPERDTDKEVNPLATTCPIPALMEPGCQWVGEVHTLSHMTM